METLITSQHTLEVLSIMATDHTPSVHFDASIGKFSIIGKSIPNNPSLFYTPIYQWLQAYLDNPSNETELTIYFNYCNSSTVYWMRDIFKLMSQLTIGPFGFSIVWVREANDDDALELGEELSRLSGIPFQYQIL